MKTTCELEMDAELARQEIATNDRLTLVLSSVIMCIIIGLMYVGMAWNKVRGEK